MEHEHKGYAGIYHTFFLCSSFHLTFQKVKRLLKGQNVEMRSYEVLELLLHF